MYQDRISQEELDKVFESGVKTGQMAERDRLVHCKDCIYNTLNTDGEAESWCYKHGINIEGDDFCSYGEKQVTGKLDNADDSLLTEDSEACKEQKSKLEPVAKNATPTEDCISRQAAIDALQGRK